MEVGEFYTTQKKWNLDNSGIESLEILQVLGSEGPFLYVKDWAQRYYEWIDYRYVLDSRCLILQCLSDDFVALVTGELEVRD